MSGAHFGFHRDGTTMSGFTRTCLLAVTVAGPVAPAARAADGVAFRVGAGEKDITPPDGVPMWGYGARHDLPSQGALDNAKPSPLGTMQMEFLRSSSGTNSTGAGLR